MRYFIKQLVSNPIYTPGGTQVPWEEIGDDSGLLCTEHPILIKTLEDAMAHRRGGVREISEEQIEEYKKKASEAQSRRDSAVQPIRENIRLDNYRERKQPLPRSEPNAAVAVADPGSRLDPRPRLPIPGEGSGKPLPRKKTAPSPLGDLVSTQPEMPIGNTENP